MPRKAKPNPTNQTTEQAPSSVPSEAPKEPAAGHPLGLVVVTY